MDDVIDWELIDELVPEATSWRVIATSNRRPTGERFDGVVVEVADMEPDEACELACQLLGDLPEGEARSLVAELHHRPLAIAHCCGYLKKTPGVSVNELLRSLRADMPVTLDAVVERSLRSVYKKTIADLEILYAPAVRVLEAAAFCEPVWRAKSYPHKHLSVVSTVYLGSCLQDEREYELATVDLISRRALKTLQERYLVDVDSSTVLHSFTAEVLRDLFRPRQLEIYRKLAGIGETIAILEIILTGGGPALQVAELIDRAQQRRQRRPIIPDKGMLDFVNNMVATHEAGKESLLSDILGMYDVLESTLIDYAREAGLDIDNID